MRRSTSMLRLMSWAVLLLGLAGAVLLWISAREVVEETKRIVGHVTVTFQDLDVRISLSKIVLGVASLVFGAFLWALGRAVANLTADRSAAEGESTDD